MNLYRLLASISQSPTNIPQVAQHDSSHRQTSAICDTIRIPETCKHLANILLRTPRTSPPTTLHISTWLQAVETWWLHCAYGLRCMRRADNAVLRHDFRGARRGLHHICCHYGYLGRTYICGICDPFVTIDQAAEVLQAAGSGEEMGIRYHELDTGAGHYGCYGYSDRGCCTTRCLPSSFIYAWSCYPLLHSWTRLSHESVQSFGVEGAVPDQFDAQGRAGLAGDILYR